MAGSRLEALTTVLVYMAASVAGKAEEAVLTGTGANFKDIITGNDFVAAEFYASWCGHCKKLAPEWEKAAKVLKESDPPVTLVKVEATEEGNKELATKYGVGGFPTIKIFKNGNVDSPIDYTGPRDADGIVTYLQARAGPASTELTSAAQVDKLKESDAAVVGVFKGKDSTEQAAFLKLADALRDDFAFGHTTDPKLAGKGVSAPGVVLYKQYDNFESIYKGTVSEAELRAWLEEEAAPVLPELDPKPRNQRAVSALFAKPCTKVVLIYSKESKEAEAFQTAARSSAEKDRKLKHLLISAKGNENALKFFDLQEQDVPALFIQNEDDQKFVKKNVGPSELASFISEFQAGKLEATIKSEDPPEKNDGPVKVVTAKTFDEIVRSGNDVLLEFYAPWCGHCKSLAPIYEKVGKAFQQNNSVTVAKMDATANDVPKQFAVRGFPTIKFISGKDGSVLDYAGDRSQKDLIAFVERRGGPGPDKGEEDEEDYYADADAGHDEL